jgi:hypothetical protein
MQKEAKRSADETVLLLLSALRSVDLAIVDGATDADGLEQFLVDHDATLREICLTRRVQANIAERGLPILELLGRRWGRQKLFVTELGCSFGLIGRVLVSASATLQDFDRYFGPHQQRPTDVALVVGYRGVDLAPPDERWLLACIPFPAMRTRLARFIYEVPAPEACSVTIGSALDPAFWGPPPEGTVAVILTSFMLYQLPAPVRKELEDRIAEAIRSYGGTWVNLDVAVEGDKTRFIVSENGKEVIELENDLCASWRHHG